MGGGVQVEKPVKRPLRLTALLWCYLLSTGGILLVTLLLWWLCFAMLVNLGFVLPAAYAAGQVQSTAEVLSREFDTEVIPHYYRWAVFDADGDMKDSGGMDRRHADYARQRGRCVSYSMIIPILTLTLLWKRSCRTFWAVCWRCWLGCGGCWRD